MNRKERPILLNLVNKGTSDVEKFQNEVIRPIIKMQHQLLIIIFKDYLKNRKIDFNVFSDDKKAAKIKSILKTDTKFKTLILGTVVGQFSVVELDTYLRQTSEYNKRINQIVSNRFIDSISNI